MSTTVAQLEYIKTSIEKMDHHNQIEVLKMLYEYTPSITINENPNGTFINLTTLPNDLIECLNKYVNYIEKQENILNDVESRKAEYAKLLKSGKNKTDDKDE